MITRLSWFEVEHLTNRVKLECCPKLNWLGSIEAEP